MVTYRAISAKFILLIAITIVLSILLVFALLNESENLNLFILILFLINAVLLFQILIEFKSIKDQRIVNLKKFAEARGYVFVGQPQDEQISEFKKFKALSKSLLPMYMHKFFNLFIPNRNQTDGINEKPKIVTISTTISAGESSSTHYTQVYKFDINKKIPIFYLAGGHHFSLSNLFRTQNVFKDIKDLKEIDIQKFNFPSNKYKLYSSDKNIKDFFTKDFVDLLNDGLKKKKETIYIESNGRDMIFYIIFKRHTLTGMDFFINLFKVLIKSLDIR